MTPMIDVVFQLLIYFLVTFSTPDVLAQLDISRPAPDAAAPAGSTPPRMIRVEIATDNLYRLNGRTVSRPELSGLLTRLAGICTEQTVLIVCEGPSRHEQLVSVLDLCAGLGLANLSVVSGKD